MRTSLVLLVLLSACGGFSGEGSGGGLPASSQQSGVTAGTLTAGAWDDNLNFDLFTKYVAENEVLEGAPQIAAAERTAARDAFEARSAKTRLDIALVIDTTGSMRDEMAYLRAEFRELASSLAGDFPEASQRWALVAYGDEGDDYIVDPTDFTTSSARFKRTLDGQGDTGGGDYPEASHRGLQEMTRLSWRGGDVARLVFWVADAPHHAEHEGTLTAAIRKSRDEDVHIYPVASSGVDELTELTMRSTAQLTGGRYMFLTDDSGVGDAHKEPSIPCYIVTTLRDAIQRMVRIEMEGVYREPTADEIIRVGGALENGRCQLSDGTEARAF